MAKGFDVSGFADLDLALGRLKVVTAKAALRRALKTAAEPLAQTMRQLAPDDPLTGAPDLRSTIAVSTKLSRRQAALHKSAEGRSAVEVFVGPAPRPSATQQEFGNINHGPQPFARPAWDREKDELVVRLGDEMTQEVAAAVGRAKKRGTLRG